MFLRTEVLPSKKFIGKNLMMSFIQNQTPQLWQSFMPLKNSIKNAVGIELYSIEEYPSNFFENFNPNTDLKKWAAIEVSNFDSISENLETLIVPEGKYVVFLYKGKPENAQPFFQNIFTKWLPEQNLKVDNRPHLAIMGEKYKNNSEESEEEIWIPIKELIIEN